MLKILQYRPWWCMASCLMKLILQRLFFQTINISSSLTSILTSFALAWAITKNAYDNGGTTTCFRAGKICFGSISGSNVSLISGKGWTSPSAAMSNFRHPHVWANTGLQEGFVTRSWILTLPRVCLRLQCYENNTSSWINWFFRRTMLRIFWFFDQVRCHHALQGTAALPTSYAATSIGIEKDQTIFRESAPS